jgi:hypothetical protein
MKQARDGLIHPEQELICSRLIGLIGQRHDGRAIGTEQPSAWIPPRLLAQDDMRLTACLSIPFQRLRARELMKANLAVPVALANIAGESLHIFEIGTEDHDFRDGSSPRITKKAHVDIRPDIDGASVIRPLS